MNRRKIALTVIVSGLAFAINYFISYFLTKYITKTVGTAAYGYVSLAKTIASYAIIATTALNSYSTRFIAVSYHNGDYKQANAYYNSVLFSNIFVGMLLILFCALFISPLTRILNIPSNIRSDVSVLFFLVFLNLFLTLSSTAFQASAVISNQLHVVSVFKLVSYIAEGWVLFTLYFAFSPKVYYVGFGTIIGTLVLLFTYILISKRETPQLHVSLKCFSVRSVKMLCVNGIWYSFNSLGNTLNSGLDLLVSNFLLGPFYMGQVSIVKTITNIFNALYSIIAQPFEPVFIADYSKDDKEGLIKHLHYSSKISGLISNLAFAGFVSLGAVYYRLWLPEQDTKLLYYLTVVALLSSVFDGPIYPLYYIYTLTIKNKMPCLVTIIGGVFNVISMIIMIKTFNVGIFAIFISTTIIMSIINGVFNPLYMAKCLKVPLKTIYPTLMKCAFSCAVMTLCLFVVNNIVLCVTNWGEFLVVAFLSCIIGALIHGFIVFGCKETVVFLKQLLKKNIRIIGEK